MTETRCSSTHATRLPLWQTAVEVLAIVVLLFLLGGGPVPEVNEAHYLAKAKHFWNPAWCARDFFLNSADAHYLFYLTWGWPTRSFSLAATAWLGRLAAWLLLAVAWQRLSWSVVPRWGFALLSAGIWVVLLQRFHMSGEWIVGGIEAKVPAYGFVLLGLADVSLGRWSRAWIWFGAASAFHVLVGGWTVVLALFAWALQPRRERPELLRMGPALLIGGMLSLPGLLPALHLTTQSDNATTAAACSIYVFDRLRHHLLLSDFPAVYVARHLTLCAAFLWLAWSLRRNGRYGRLAGCVSGALVLAVIGALLQVLGNSSLLRFYWFRPTDVMVPLGVALGIIVWIVRLNAARPQVARGLLGVAIVLLCGHVVDLTAKAHREILSAADIQGQVDTDWRLSDWREACRWIEQHLPEDACVLTPWDHQTFKWYAGRSEVATWKDIPQDAAGIVQWQQRRENIAELMRLTVIGSPTQFRQRLRELSTCYGFEYWLVRSRPTLPSQGLRLEFKNRSYSIYHVPPARPAPKADDRP